MNRNFHRMSLLAGCFVGFAICGCDRGSTSLAPMPVEQAPQAIEDAFKGAATEVAATATDATAAMKADETVVVLESLQELSQRPDISDEQRATAARAMAAYLQKAREAAEKGDKKAEDALQHYRATK
ncbi:MAG: hypothetical protein IPK15_12315 [Verrucomicrobia bacterium]|nr:hypothetical protein [Verrucomicrobiota bacterium]